MKNKKTFTLKESDSIQSSSDDKGYIINCAGERIPITDEGFTSRCAIGNTDDYLENFKKFINPEILALGDPSLISIIIPSYASREKELYRMLILLCSQEYPVPAEILVFINEPENASKSVQQVNERHHHFISSFENGIAADIPSELLETQQTLLTLLGKNNGKLKLRCLRQVVEGGLPGVYQIASASWVARGRDFCDRMSIDGDRPAKIKCIEEHFKSSLFLLCDDDTEIKDTNAVARAYHDAIDHDAVVLGKIHIQYVETIEKYSAVLRDVMQLFFDFKYDHGLIFLTPRGMLLAHILKVGSVKIGQPFADQIFFAAIARDKVQHFINANTSIAESDHPGNGNFLKKMRLYLEGQENDALDVFKNVLARYQENKHKGKYCAADIKRLIASLKTRDISKIASVALELIEIKK